MSLEAPHFLEFSEYRADPQTRVLMRGDEVIPLPPKAFEVLMALLESGGSPLTREQLMTAVWGETFVEEANLTQTISVLRKALGEAADQPRFIVTIPRRGYRFGVPVSQVGTEDRTPIEPPTVNPPKRYRTALAAIFAMMLLGVPLGAWWWTNRPLSSAIRSIAVLPLQNLSGDPNQEYFSDGTTEALISSLARIHAVAVTSRTSIMRYKGTTKPAREIGRELGVDAIVEGSVQRAGGRVRFTAQLIRASTDRHMWANEYERDMTDILRLEAEVAQAIAREIQAQVTPEETRLFTSAPTINPEAHEQYLLARHHWFRTNAADYRLSIEYFDRAIQLQPDYAAAYAGLSLAWRDLTNSGPVPGAEDRARKAALRALELDPNLSEGHTALGGVLFGDWDWAGAEKELKRALELNKDSLETCECYANLLMLLGRTPEAIALMEHSVKVDPLSAAMNERLGTALYFARRYQEAVPHYLRALELDAQNRFAHIFLARVYEKLGRFPDAVAVLDRPGFQSSAQLAHLYALMGRREEALKIVSALTKPGSKALSGEVAGVYFALGDKDRGFEWLAKSIDQRELSVAYAKFSPAYDEVRSDPRFQALVARLKIPD